MSETRAPTPQDKLNELALQFADKDQERLAVDGRTRHQLLTNAFIEGAKACRERSQTQAVAWITPNELKHLQGGSMAAIGPRSHERELPLYLATDSVTSDFVSRLDEMGYVIVKKTEIARVEAIVGEILSAMHISDDLYSTMRDGRA